MTAATDPAAQDATDGPPSSVAGWPVVRAWPRSSDHALLELGTPHGSRGGQWWASADRAEAAASEIPGATLSGSTLIHPANRDDRLPRFAERIAAGEHVVAHRPGRRAVFRADRPGAPFTKVTRRRRALSALTRHHAAAAAAGANVRIAPVLDHGPDWLTLGSLPGRTLFDLGSDARVSDRELAGCWHALGRALRALHQTEPDGELTECHDARAELDTTRSWLDPVRGWGLLPQVDDGRVDAVLTALHQPAGERVVGLLHRDLHDQQVLIDEAEPHPGLLDFDTAAWGEPALDIANVLAHLNLRQRQDLLTPWRAAAARQAFLGAVEPDGRTRDRIEAYRPAAQLRLSAVYALRPRWRRLAQQLFLDTLGKD